LGTGQLIRKDTVLCTWNGDWGVVAEGAEADAWSSPVPTSDSLGSSPVPTDAASFPAHVEPCADAMGIWRRDPEHESKLERKLAVRLQSHEKVLLIKEKFVAFVREWAEKRRCSRYAWAVEVCGRTFLSSGNIRFHTHACFDFGKKVKIQIQSLLFEGTQPHVSDSIGSLSFPEAEIIVLYPGPKGVVHLLRRFAQTLHGLWCRCLQSHPDAPGSRYVVRGRAVGNEQGPPG